MYVFQDGTCAKLNLVDLAGSERLKDSQVTEMSSVKKH